MPAIVMGILLVAGIAGGGYFAHQKMQESSSDQAAGADGDQAAGDETNQKSKMPSFGFGKKTEEGAEDKKEGKKSKFSMPKIPTKNSVQTMMMKQSLKNGGVGAAAKMALG